MDWASVWCKSHGRRPATHRVAPPRNAPLRNGGSTPEPHPTPAHSLGLSGGLSHHPARRSVALSSAARCAASQLNGGGQPPHTPPLSLRLSGGLISVHQPPPLVLS
jgi:hypothetical protein